MEMLRPSSSHGPPPSPSPWLPPPCCPCGFACSGHFIAVSLSIMCDRLSTVACVIASSLFRAESPACGVDRPHAVPPSMSTEGSRLLSDDYSSLMTWDLPPGLSGTWHVAVLATICNMNCGSGRDGCHSATVPPGDFRRRPSPPWSGPGLALLPGSGGS